MPPIVETVGLTKRFVTAPNYGALFRLRRKEDLTAVDHVSLQVEEGELFGLLGPNGAGKTTLVKVLCTLILPSEGRAMVCGRDVVDDAGEVRSLVGLIDCQERSFFWRLTGRQNLIFFAGLHDLYGSEAQQRVDQVLERVGLSEHADRRFMAYSSGMRQRMAVARGLLVEPRVLFLDEPTRSLDPMSAHELRKFVRTVLVEELGITVFLVTHRLEEAEQLCDRVAVMHRGRIIACGPVSQIKQVVPSGRTVRLSLGGIGADRVADLTSVVGVIDVQCENGTGSELELQLTLDGDQGTFPSLVHHLVTNGAIVRRCHMAEISLEEAFVHLMETSDDS